MIGLDVPRFVDGAEDVVTHCPFWHPLPTEDLAVMAVAGGVGEHVARAFVEAVVGERDGVGLEAVWRCQIDGVAVNLRFCVGRRLQLSRPRFSPWGRVSLRSGGLRHRLIRRRFLRR